MLERETAETAVRHAKLKASLLCEVDSAQMKSKDPDTISISSRSSSNFSIERYLSTPVDDEPASACAILSATARQSPIAEIWNPNDNWRMLDAQRIPDTDEVQNESDMVDSLSDIYVTGNASSFGSSASASSHASFLYSLGAPHDTVEDGIKIL